jgi:hypothetical protein
MTQRRRLDAFLVEQAQEAGAEFRDGFSRRHDPCRSIGADGANGTWAPGSTTICTVALEKCSCRPHRFAAADQPGSSRAATAGSSRRATTRIWG